MMLPAWGADTYRYVVEVAYRDRNGTRQHWVKTWMVTRHILTDAVIDVKGALIDSTLDTLRRQEGITATADDCTMYLIDDRPPPPMWERIAV